MNPFTRTIGIAVLLVIEAFAGATRASADDIDSISLDSLLQAQERTQSRQVSAASKYAQTTREAPASVTIISADDIRQFGWQTLEEALATVRGFYISDDLNYSYLGVRGYLRPSDFNNRITLLLNGSSLNELTNGQPPLNTLFTLDLSLVDRIEIIRGPGSSLYGTGAMTAVINIVTKDTEALEGITVRANASSPNGGGAAVCFGQEWKHGQALVLSARVQDQLGEDIYFTAYDDPETNNGVAEDLDWEKSLGLFGQTRLRELIVQAYVMSRLKGFPTASYGVAFNDPAAETEDTYGGVQADYTRRFGLQTELLGKAFYNVFHYDGLYPSDPPWPDAPDYMNEKRFGSELRFQWTPRSFHRVIFGAEYSNHFRNEYVASDGEVDVVNENRPFTDYSLFFQDEYQLSGKLLFTGGVRQSWYTQGFDALVPRIALTAIPEPRTSLKVMYGEAFRAPALMEAYYSFPEQSKANPGLEPEKIRLYEICADHEFTQAISGDLSLYSFQVRDMIDAVIDPADELSVFRNANKVSGQGVETEVNYEDQRGSRAYLNYSLQQARNDADDVILSNSPQNILKGGLTIPLNKFVLAAVESQTESFRFTLLRTKTEPATIVNLALSARRTLLPLTAVIRVRNVFDADVGHPGSWEHLTPISSVDMPIIPQRDRTIVLTLGYSFGGDGR